MTPATFVIIGAMKSGTSTLREHLDTHPDVSMSKLGECNFFIAERNWVRGINWYRQQFDSRKPCRGDSSPNYTKYPTFSGVAERMHAVLPDARLVYIMRDPIKRALSHYAHNLAHGREARDIDEVFEDPEHSDYVLASRYHHQLARYLTYFDQSQLLLLSLEQLSADPAATLRALFEFIGADPDFSPADAGKVFHQSSEKRVPTRLTRPLTRIPGGQVVRSVLGRFMEPPLEKPQLSPRVHARLTQCLAPDLASLREVSGRSFDEWSM